MTTVVVDREWKEVNHEFGHQEIVPEHEQEVGLAYQTMEFEFENVDAKIKLRAKSKILHSTGLTLWTCSQILGAYLAENASLIQDQRVLELGAGLGLCAILSHHLGASEVIATDGDLEVLRNLRYNMEENRRTAESTLSCPQLIWGEGLNTFENVYAKQSVILATDVFYSPHLVDPLWRTVDRLLEADGVFMLGFCPHNVTVGQVLDRARELSFTWTCPNISEGGDEEEDYLSNTSCFGYFVFLFERKR
jgi:predicted nicotinamide N-methyase